MDQQNVRIPRWRAVVLCVAGALSMIKPLTGGLEMCESAAAAARADRAIVSPTYGEVHEAGPFTADELGRAEQRLRVLGFPRVQFASAELATAANDVRRAGLVEVHKIRAERAEKAGTAWATRSVGVVLVLMGLGGIVFYVWLGYVLVREGNHRRAAATAAGVPAKGWIPWRKPRRHGKICFGRQVA